MKKNRKISVIAACAAVAMAGVGFVAGGGSASATGHEYIYFKTRAAGTQQPDICAFYDNVETSYSYDICDASYGNYNAASKTLTLGAGVNNLPNGHVEIRMDGVTVAAGSNIASAIYASSVEGLTLDFGNYSFTDTSFKMTDSSSDSWSNFGNELTIKSGTINIPSINVYGPLSIEGGVININGEPVVAVTAHRALDISGGTINIPDCSMAIDAIDADLNISGGVINAEDIKTTGLDATGNINISGGDINLKSNEVPAGFGVFLSNGKNLTINGGNLTIDGFEWGISGTNSKIYFNDGTTIVRNSKSHTIWIEPAADPENDIVFGEGMGIKEDTYVFYGSVSEGTGIADPGEVTIAKGYTYRKHYGWEDIDDDTKTGSDVKVPDTGVFSGNSNGVMVAAISVGAVITLAAGAVATYCLMRHHNGNIKFQKK